MLKKIWFLAANTSRYARIICLPVFLLWINAALYGQNNISATADKALYEILNLRTTTARTLIAKGKAEEPGNLYYDYLENWLEVIELTVYEQDDRYPKYLQSFEDRIKRIKATQNQSSPSYNILLGEMYAHAGMANMLYSDYLSGFRKILASNEYVGKSLKEHPGFWMNDKLSGTMNVAFDMMPSVLRWFANLFGLKGNAATGYKQLDQYLRTVRSQAGLQSEAMLYYNFVLKMGKREQEAAEFMKAGTNLSQSPALNIYFLSNLLYVNGRNEEALTVLASFPKDKIEVPFRHISYLEGKEKMNRLDPDAYVPLSTYLETSHFKNNKREVCLKLAYFYLMLNNRERFNYYTKLFDKLPKAKMDRDKEADVEKDRGYEPHPALLKARFLVAGGYYNRAKAVIQSIAFNTLSLEAYQTEYYLLLAKIGLANRQFDEAIALSNKAISIGRDRKEHYAADAALQAGLAAQQENKITMAIDYWKEALDIDGQDDVYIENIHKIAKLKISLFKSYASR